MRIATIGSSMRRSIRNTCNWNISCGIAAQDIQTTPTSTLSQTDEGRYEAHGPCLDALVVNDKVLERPGRTSELLIITSSNQGSYNHVRVHFKMSMLGPRPRRARHGPGGFSFQHAFLTRSGVEAHRCITDSGLLYSSVQ